jgi:Mor family transcriptional regulator
MEQLKFRKNENKDRNIAIYQDRLSGLSWSQLIAKYNLTVKTLYTIVKRIQLKVDSSNQNQNQNQA